jgi:hypothetical protein
MSAKEAQQQSAGAPVKVMAGGTFVNVDPRPVANTVGRLSGLGEKGVQ